MIFMDKLLCLEYTAIYSMRSAELNTDKTDGQWVHEDSLYCSYTSVYV